MARARIVTSGVAGAGFAAVALLTALPDLCAQQPQSARSSNPVVTAQGGSASVHFTLALLDDGKDAKAEGNGEAELKADFHKWLKQYAPSLARDPLGLEAMASYFASVADHSAMYAKPQRGWIPQPWINREFDRYNRAWAPFIYALDHKQGLDRAYKAELARFFAEEILIRRMTEGPYADTKVLLPLIIALPASCRYDITPRKAVQTIDVARDFVLDAGLTNFVIEAQDSLSQYLGELYPATKTDREKRERYSRVLATLNPHAIQHTLGEYFILKPAMIIVLPPEAFLNTVRDVSPMYAKF